MSKLEFVGLKISKQLATALKKKAGNNQSDFIRQAIQEKLSREVKEDETLNTMVEQIKNMDPLALHGSLSDLVYTAQVIFKKLVEHDFLLKEIKEQISQEYEEEFEEDDEGEQEEIEIPTHVSHELSQYEKDQLIIDEYYKSVEQKYKR